MVIGNGQSGAFGEVSFQVAPSEPNESKRWMNKRAAALLQRRGAPGEDVAFGALLAIVLDIQDRLREHWGVLTPMVLTAAVPEFLVRRALEMQENPERMKQYIMELAREDDAPPPA